MRLKELIDTLDAYYQRHGDIPVLAFGQEMPDGPYNEVDNRFQAWSISLWEEPLGGEPTMTLRVTEGETYGYLHRK